MQSLTFSVCIPNALLTYNQLLMTHNAHTLRLIFEKTVYSNSNYVKIDVFLLLAFSVFEVPLVAAH